MFFYTLGYITGLVSFLLTIYIFFRLVIKLFKKVKDSIYPNPTKEILKEYLFIWNFVEDITTVDELKEKLKTIPSKKLYKNNSNKIYFTKEEPLAFDDVIQEISIRDILNSETYFLSLVESLKNITLYDKSDLKNITKSSSIVWIKAYKYNVHFIFDKDRIILPNSYPKDNKYKFGYDTIYTQEGLMFVYDVKNDIKINVDFEYKSVKLFGNIAYFSNDEENYIVYDLDTNIKIATTNTINPNEYEHLINYSIIELKDYVKLFPTAKNQIDLVNMKLWNEKVLVSKIPEHYAQILETPKSGVIRYDYPVCGDIFDMSVELPIEFKKKNGDYLYLGINLECLILEDRDCLNYI